MKFAIRIIAVCVLLAIAAAWSLRNHTLGPAAADALTNIQPALQQEVTAAGFAWGAALHIRIYKQESELELWLAQADGRYALFRTYPICTWSGTLGPKQREGDKQSPEGFYRVTPAQMKPDSRYHLAFNLGFPNDYDRAQGYTGSFLMVHGSCLSVGCYAMGNAAIEQIYLLAQTAHEHGQAMFAVHAFPFRMTETNMAQHAGSEWSPFWQNMKEGYDLFVQTRLPPAAKGAKGRYIFD